MVATLRDIGPPKLLPRERELIREAADELIFTEDLGADYEARMALADVELLCRELIDSERWDSEPAMRLADDVASCGPELLREPLAA